jgi:integrase
MDATALSQAEQIRAYPPATGRAVVPIAPPTASIPAVMADLSAKAADYATAAKAPATRRAYESDWRHYRQWCEAHGLVPLSEDPRPALAYLTAHAGELKVSTLQRRLAAIRDRHRYGGIELDTSSTAFRDVWKGIRNTHGAPTNKRAPLITSILRRALSTLPAGSIGDRDRALLLIGFAAALRRSELAGLEASASNTGTGWIEETPDGLAIHLGRSKTDQEGHGDVLGVPYGADPATCPVRAFRAWLQASAITEGPVFRAITRHGKLGDRQLTGAAVALIVKRAVSAAALADGMDKTEAAEYAARFAGHSLRAGLATSAAANDAPGHAIQRQLRHRSFNTTTGYIRTGRLFKQNAAGMAGL